MLLSSGRIKEAIESLENAVEIDSQKNVGVTESNYLNIEIALISLLDGRFEPHLQDIASVSLPSLSPPLSIPLILANNDRFMRRRLTMEMRQ